MVRTVAKYLLVALVVILVLAWFAGGGIGTIESAAADFSPWQSFSGSGGIQLPWAVPIPQGPSIATIVNTGNQQQEQLQGGNTQISQASQAQTFGNQSQYGNITLSSDGATASNPQEEYLVIENGSQQSVDISGWSLQSALTGARAYIPLGASFFQMGELNQQNNIELEPGGVAIVTTGESPVGTSFRENICSGYLEQLQHYTPPIQTQCPSPGNDATQASQYGASCGDYVSSIPFCTFPQIFPSGISGSCEIYAQTTFSYNGCVDEYANYSDFPLNDWRIYLNGSRELWNNDHDTIRLLDTKGEVVAVTSY